MYQVYESASNSCCILVLPSVGRRDITQYKCSSTRSAQGLQAETNMAGDTPTFLDFRPACSLCVCARECKNGLVLRRISQRPFHFCDTRDPPGSPRCPRRQKGPRTSTWRVGGVEESASAEGLLGPRMAGGHVKQNSRYDIEKHTDVHRTHLPLYVLLYCCT